MVELMLKAIKPALSEMLDKVKKAAPGYIDMAIAWLTGLLPGSIDKVTAAFRTLYSDITTRLIAWLPTVRAPAVAGVDKLLVFVKTKMLAKL
jgi:hypothetical protein